VAEIVSASLSGLLVKTPLRGVRVSKKCEKNDMVMGCDTAPLIAYDNEDHGNMAKNMCITSRGLKSD